jgi:hypothetical protein
VVYFNSNVAFECVRGRGFKADFVKRRIFTFKMSNATSFQNEVFCYLCTLGTNAEEPTFRVL